MESADETAREIRQAWERFIERTAPLRADLHRYCRSLSGSVWEAEDLAQETLLRAFARLGSIHHPIRDPKAYMLRIAGNLWVDRQRRPHPESVYAPPQPPSPDQRAEVRDAARELMRRLPPRERAAIVLKDVFDYSLEEIAEILETTVGAVKSALHRGRSTLASPEPTPLRIIRKPSRELLDSFVEAFNARDPDRLTTLMRADARADVVGMVEEVGAEIIRNGTLRYTMFKEAGAPLAERREFEGEPIVALWYATDDGTRVVRDVLRFQEEDRKIALLRYYYFCPQTLKEVAAALGVPLSDNGYSYTAPA